MDIEIKNPVIDNKINTRYIRSFLLALFSGCLLAVGQLSQFGWISFVAYIPLITIAYRKKFLDIFKFSFFSFFLYYFITFKWISATIIQFTKISFELSILALFFLSIIFAFYHAAVFCLTRWLSIYFNWSYLWLFPVGLCVSEYLKEYGYIVSFPWGSPAYSLLTVRLISQIASVVGVYGLVFIVGLINSAIFELLFIKNNNNLQIVTLSVITVVICYGWLQINNQSKYNHLENIKIATLQGNNRQQVDQNSDFNQIKIFDKYKELQQKAMMQNVKITVWPESSYPYHVSRNNFHQMLQLKNLSDVNIIPATSFDSENKIYNTVFMVNRSKDIVGIFDKNHLVPFGEYVPWPFKSFFSKFIPHSINFNRNTVSKSIPIYIVTKNKLKRIFVAIIICYDGGFPKISRNFTKNKAELLINVSNDSWYGNSWEPDQHLKMYQMRSIETARNCIRATDTGISAWVDVNGDIHRPTNLFREALSIYNISTSTEKTAYQKFGDIVPKICLYVLMSCIIYSKYPRTKLDLILSLIGVCIVLFFCVLLEQTTSLLNDSTQTQKTTMILLGLMIWFRVDFKFFYKK